MSRPYSKPDGEFKARGVPVGIADEYGTVWDGEPGDASSKIIGDLVARDDETLHVFLDPMAVRELESWPCYLCNKPVLKAEGWHRDDWPTGAGGHGHAAWCPEHKPIVRRPP